MKSKLSIFASCLLLVIAVAFLYLQTAQFEFLRFDDPDYTFYCPFVRNGISYKNIITAFTNFTHAAIWMPLTYITYMGGITLCGPSISAHHLVNVALHIFNTLLLFALLWKLHRHVSQTVTPVRTENISAIIIIALATALWALHPQRAEAVAWIASRKELLFTTFTILGLLTWHYTLLSTSKFLTRVFALLITYIFMVAACLSKPTAMCFPFLALAWELLITRRINKHAFFRYLPLFLFAVATGLIAIYSQTHPSGYTPRELFSASLPWRLLNAAVAVGLNLFQMVIPYGIHLDYRATPGVYPLYGTLGLFVFVITLLIILIVLIRKRNSAVVAIILFFITALLPTLGIFGSFGEHARADRFLYLPAIAISIAIVYAFSNYPTQRVIKITNIFLFLITIVYMGVSFPVVSSYRNDYTAFSRTLQFDPEHGRALAHVASEKCARFADIDRGITLYRKSQALRPRDETASQLAYTLALRGLSSDYAEIRQLCAKFACNHSLDTKGMALEALGVTAMRQRKWKEAISLLEDSIKAPRRFYSAEDAQLRLAASYANIHETEKAQQLLAPLTQSKRTDIATRARDFRNTLKKNPNSILLF